MQIRADRTDVSSLDALAEQAVQLCCAGEFVALAESFGYAVAIGREPSSAIAEDLRLSCEGLGATHLASDAKFKTEVKYFKPGSFLLAVVECTLPTNNGRAVLVELVVTEREGDVHVTLEQISAAA